MSYQATTRQDDLARQYLFGPERLQATILATAAETEGHFDLIDSVLPAGAVVPLHLHTRYAERFWVASGSITAWAGQDSLTLGPGDYYCVPPNVPHTFESGPDGCRAIVISSPASFAELIARTGTPAQLAGPETEFDIDRFMKVTIELGDVLLGPPGAKPADVRPGDGASAG